MRRRPPELSEDTLFDLPLTPEPTSRKTRRDSDPPSEQSGLPLEERVSPTQSSETARRETTEPSPPALPTTTARRLAGGVLDLGVHLLVLFVVLLGTWSMGALATETSLLPFVVFLGAFSFIYHVLPLSFWGQTPGMASVGLMARGVDGKPLTMSQAARRWLGAVLTTLSLGVLFLIASKTGRSIADRLSATVIRGHDT